MQNRNNYVVKPNVSLVNRVNNERVDGDLINEEEIDGRSFYVIRVGQRVMKLAKDAYTHKKFSMTR
jgi:hypothetical protein